MPAPWRGVQRQRWRSDMGVEPTQDEIIAPQTVLKTAAVTGPRAAPLRILPRREGPRPSAVGLQARTVADDTERECLFRSRWPNTSADAAALSDDEAALLARAVAAMSRAPRRRARHARTRSKSLLADRMRELHAANASLEREVQERRLIELALRESEARLRDLALTTADWLWEVDASGRYTSCSHQGDRRARLHPGRDHGANAVRPHGGGGRRGARARVRTHDARALRLHGAQEPQPAQGRA